MTDREFGVTADVALFTGRDGKLQVLLIQRGNEPSSGKWALPGGFVEIDEDLVDAAVRELEEETGVSLQPSDVRQTGIYGRPGRDPRMRVITVVYAGFVNELSEPVAGDDAAAARLWPVEEIVATPEMLAFDHHQIITETMAAMRLTTQ